MPDHLKNTDKNSEAFNSYLKGFVNSKLEDNSKKSREELRGKVKKFASSIVIMLAG